MTQMKQLTIIIFTVTTMSLLFSSCEEPVTLKLNDHSSQVVIEGLVTNLPGRQYVKVTNSTSFYDQGQSPRITNAIVNVKDDLGDNHIFVHNPRQHADSIGYYFPADGFVGQLGRTYALSVTIGESVYTAEDQLAGVVPIDSLGFQLNDGEKKNPKTAGKFYEVLFYAHENPSEVNYYLFKFYRNDSVQYYFDTDIYFSEDKYIAENIDGIASPVYYGLSDRAKVEMFSISQKAYVFYDDLSLLLNSDGGMFNQPPARPRSNLSNGAWGFFQASAISKKEITIE